MDRNYFGYHTLDKKDKIEYSALEIQNCISVLEKLVKNSSQLTELDDQQRIALLTAAGKLSRPDRDEIRKRNKDVKKSRREIIANREKKKRAATGIRSARDTAVFTAPKQIKSSESNQKELAPARSA